MKGVPLVTQFRYPLWDAKAIQPPKGVELAGSSSSSPFFKPIRATPIYRWASSSPACT